MRGALLVTLLLALPAGAASGPRSSLTQTQRAGLESLRAQIAGQLQLQAYDLLDELVYGWVQQPVFAIQTPVVLADVSVPVGFGSGLAALIETHFAGLVVKHPRSGVVLSHCPQCTALVVHSGSKGTVVGRGVDQPEALAAAGERSGARHALFLDFEAEGAALVLRARITSLEPALPIVYARTLSTQISAPALLRTGERLKSAAEARAEYEAALAGRGTVLLPLRIGVRTFASPDQWSTSPIGVPPMVWLMGGIEVGMTQARAWTGSFTVGGSWTPELHTAFMAQARVARLLSGTAVSLTRPDLYGFVGGSVVQVNGLAAMMFANRVPTAQELLAANLGIEPQTRFGTAQVGLELRVKNRIGATFFLESMPSLSDAPAVGEYLDFGVVTFRAIGVEVSFWF
jgi:hypothetical protein